MKLEKKHWVIIGVVVAILVWYFFLRKKKPESNWKPEYRDVNKDVAALKGISLANISTFGTPLT